jgi:8-oxo-dGTP pyrophosphatase MutT (NUDIX family)
MKRFARVLIVSQDFKFLAVSQSHKGDVVWNFPGGKVESSEPPIQAARRELLEELGINAGRSELVFLSKKILNLQGVRWQGYFYLYILCPVQPVLREPDKIHSTRYLNVDEMTKLSAHQEVFASYARAKLERIQALITPLEHSQLWLNSSNY